MPDAADGVFLYLETALHAGTGERGRVADLPIARDGSGRPILPASTLRGSVLAAAKKFRPRDEIAWAFGSPPGSETQNEGVLVFHLAGLLLFPVRTYKGVFAWITSPEWLSDCRTAAEGYGLQLSLPSVPQPAEHEALVAPQSPGLTGQGTLVIEDFSFPVREADEVSALGSWLAGRGVPQDPLYGFFRERLGRAIAVLPDEACRFLLQHRIPVTRRVAIDPQTGTAREGAMWSEEFLPSETLLYTFVGTEDRGHPPPSPVNGVNWLKRLELTRLQVGANRTLGGGLVRWTWLEGG
jgi:CRISPR-associated protein Cmr4